MELWIACVLLLCAIAGLIGCIAGLRQKKTLRTIGIVLCTLAIFFLAVYIGLTLILVYGVGHRPPDDLSELESTLSSVL